MQPANLDLEIVWWWRMEMGQPTFDAIPISHRILCYLTSIFYLIYHCKPIWLHGPEYHYKMIGKAAPVFDLSFVFIKSKIWVVPISYDFFIIWLQILGFALAEATEMKWRRDFDYFSR